MQLSQFANRKLDRRNHFSQARQLVVVGILGLFLNASVNASPAPVAADTTTAASPEDAIGRFLSEQGLVQTATPSPVAEMAQQVRTKASDMASELVMVAMNFLGVPYKLGGTNRDTGFDCSGFTRHVFENSVGLVLPRRSAEQANSPDLIPVKQSELKPGDLVFFNTLRRTFSHVGIYIGDNKFIHSPRSGSVIRVEDMRVGYWQSRFDGARRAPKINANQVATINNAER